MKQHKYCVCFTIIFIVILGASLANPYNTNDNSALSQSSSQKLVFDSPSEDKDVQLPEASEYSTNNAFSSLPTVKTCYGGNDNSLILRWKELAGNISSFNGALYSEENLPKFKWLHQQGIELVINIDWKPNPVGSLEKPNPLDFYYNSTFRNQVLDHLGSVFDKVPEELVSMVIVGDEEPNGAYQWFSFSGTWPDEIVKFNQTYNDETGYWFMDKELMNSTERSAWESWMEERNSYAYNTMYSHLKSLFPEKKITMAIMENYNIGFNPGNISTDERSGYQFYTKDPRQVYSDARYAKTTYPDADISTTLWGTSMGGFYDPFYAEDFERLAYAAYIAGVSRINWFVFGVDERERSVYNWERTDESGKETFDIINSINRELMSLPVFNSSPQILEVAGYDEAGASQGIGLLEWDNTNQMVASRPEFDLSKYDLIILKDQHDLTSTFVEKVNQYVANGGHLILSGSTGASLTDPDGNPRTALMVENGSISYHYRQSAINISLATANPLDLNYNLPLTEAGRNALNFSMTANHQLVELDIPDEQNGQYPLFLYHNESNPNSGYVLYNGFSVSWESVILPLWIRSLTAFGEKIGFSDGLASEDNCHTLASISDYSEEEFAMVGFVNDETEHELYTCDFNFTARGYVQRDYWLYQRDELLEWVGALGYTNGVMNVGIQPFLAEDAVIFELLPSTPPPVGRLVVNTFPVDYLPTVGENFVVKGDVSNIMRFTSVENANATLELPSGLSLAVTDDSLVRDLDSIYSLVRGGFGYPMTFSWVVTADTTGNYSCKITIQGDNIDPVVKYVNVEVKPHVIDVFLEESRIYVTPNESYIWRVNIHHRGNDVVNDVKIKCDFPYSDWYAPHAETIINELLPGEKRAIEFNFTEWFETSPPWAMPGEEVLLSFRSIVDGVLSSETHGYVEVVSSKIKLSPSIPDEIKVGDSFNISLSIESLGLESIPGVELVIDLPIGFEYKQIPELFIGLLTPASISILNISLTANNSGRFYIEFFAQSSTAYSDPIVLTIDITTEDTPEDEVYAVHVLTPNGGESYNDSIWITWSADYPFDEIPSFLVEYSNNSGLTWIEIASNITDFSYLWNISSINPGTQYLIRITIENTDCWDISDYLFAIHDTSEKPLPSKNPAWPYIVTSIVTMGFSVTVSILGFKYGSTIIDKIKK